VQRKLIQFFALLSLAMTLGTSLGHLLELPKKLHLDGNAHLIVQRIDRGWALLGLLVVLTALLLIAHALETEGSARHWAGLALGYLIAGQLLFWAFSFPAHRVVEDWTALPQNWQAVRLHSEYPLAGAAVLNLFAFCALLVSVLRAGDSAAAATRARQPQYPQLGSP
jgi:hypothetical protein